MPDSDERPEETPNLPAVVDQSAEVAEVIHTVLEQPIFEFEGEMVRLMVGEFPSMKLPMDYGYPRGAHVKMEMEFRVRRVIVDEHKSRGGAMDLVRVHTFVLEDARIVGAFTADEVDPGVGGGLAAGAQEQETDESPEGEVQDGLPDPGF